MTTGTSKPVSRASAAGRQNLVDWKAAAPARARELEANVADFRAGLLRDAGPNPSATKTGLIESAVTIYTGILVVRTKLLHSRKSNIMDATERISWLSSSLSRCLKTLDLSAKPKPKPFHELFASKPAEKRTDAEAKTNE